MAGEPGAGADRSEPGKPVSPVTRAEIADAVRRLGVRRGDVLLVHSSLKSFGRVDGGPDAVIDAVLEAVGPEGHLIMPTFTRCRVSPETPDPEAYNPAASSCRDRTGAIPDAFWRRPQARRSLHPTHSLAVIGPRADEFVAGGERRNFDPAGPFGRYARWGGRALFLGADVGSNTTAHLAEDWLGMPFLTSEKARVRRRDGTVETVELTGYPSGLCRSYYGGGGVVKNAFQEAGVLGAASLNTTRLQLIAARDVLRVIAEQEEQRPGFLLCAGHTDEFCRRGIAACATEHPRILARIAALRAAGWAPPGKGW